jgi:hypothetical protein
MAIRNEVKFEGVRKSPPRYILVDPDIGSYTELSFRGNTAVQKIVREKIIFTDGSYGRYNSGIISSLRIPIGSLVIVHNLYNHLTKLLATAGIRKASRMADTEILEKLYKHDTLYAYRNSPLYMILQPRLGSLTSEVINSRLCFLKFSDGTIIQDSKNFFSAKEEEGFLDTEDLVDEEDDEEGDIVQPSSDDRELDLKFYQVATDYVNQFGWAEKDGRILFNPIKYTKSSVYYNYYLLKYRKHVIRTNNTPVVKQLETSAYKGGRTEMYFRGSPPLKLYALDINNMYGYIMRHALLPVDLTKRSILSKGVEASTVLLMCEDTRCCIVEATVHVPVNVPVSPVPLTKATDKEIDGPEDEFKGAHNALLFPVGEVRTTLCYPELRLIQELGYKIEIHSLLLYSSARIFAEYVEEMNSLRQAFRRNGDKVRAMWYKQAVNLVAGKFGKRKYDSVEEYDPVRKEQVLRSYRTNQLDRMAAPAVSAHITSYGRAMMWKYMELAGFENVYYIATDSLKVNADGMSRLQQYLNNEELGMFKLEAYGEFTFHEKNNYEYYDEIAKEKVFKGGRDPHADKQAEEVSGYLAEDKYKPYFCPPTVEIPKSLASLNTTPYIKRLIFFSTHAETTGSKVKIPVLERKLEVEVDLRPESLHESSFIGNIIDPYLLGGDAQQYIAPEEPTEEDDDDEDEIISLDE